MPRIASFRRQNAFCVCTFLLLAWAILLRPLQNFWALASPSCGVPQPQDYEDPNFHEHLASHGYSIQDFKALEDWEALESLATSPSCRVPQPEDCQRFDLHDGLGPRNHQKAIEVAKEEGLAWLELAVRKLREWDIETSADFTSCFGSTTYKAAISMRIERMLDLYRTSFKFVPITCDETSNVYVRFRRTMSNGTSLQVMCPIETLPRRFEGRVSEIGDRQPGPVFSRRRDGTGGETWETYPPRIILYETGLRMEARAPGDCQPNIFLESFFGRTSLLLHEASHAISLTSIIHNKSIDVKDIVLFPQQLFPFEDWPLGHAQRTGCYGPVAVGLLARSFIRRKAPENANSIAYFILMTRLRREGYWFDDRNWTSHRVREPANGPRERSSVFRPDHNEL